MSRPDAREPRRLRVPLAIEEGHDRGTEAQLRRLQAHYLISAGTGPDAREYRLFIDVYAKDLLLWTAGRPLRRVTLAGLLGALHAEGEPS